MKFRLEIECDNAAFSPEQNGVGPECARILRLVANSLELYRLPRNERESEPDCNGNRVCVYGFEEG